MFVILAGFAVTGFLLWSVSSEFFLSDSPSAIFTKALKRVKADPRVSEHINTDLYVFRIEIKIDYGNSIVNTVPCMEDNNLKCILFF